MSDQSLCRYRDWAPTPFDRKGAYLQYRQDWYVVDVSMRRALTRARVIFEAHTFKHWGPGQIEILVIEPSSINYEKALKALHEATLPE